MSKLVERKWKIASCVGFVVALAFDLIAKGTAADDMQAIAKKTAGQPIELHGWSVAQAVPRNSLEIGMCVAVLAVACWGTAAYRHEPGSYLPVVILAVLYFLSFMILV